VPTGDRPLHQQNVPENEIARTFREAEPYPDAQDARHDRDAREIHLQDLETEKYAQGQYGVVRETEGGELDSRIEMQAREYPTLEERAKPTRYPEGGGHEEAGGDERGDRDGARLSVDDRIR